MPYCVGSVGRVSWLRVLRGHSGRIFDSPGSRSHWLAAATTAAAAAAATAAAGVLALLCAGDQDRCKTRAEGVPLLLLLLLPQ